MAPLHLTARLLAYTTQFQESMIDSNWTKTVGGDRRDTLGRRGSIHGVQTQFESLHREIHANALHRGVLGRYRWSSRIGGLHRRHQDNAVGRRELGVYIEDIRTMLLVVENWGSTSRHQDNAVGRRELGVYSEDTPFSSASIPAHTCRGWGFFPFGIWRKMTLWS